MLSAATLLMMLVALEPSLALPLFAFAAMVMLTGQLGQRLFRDLEWAAARPGRNGPDQACEGPYPAARAST